MIKFVRGRIKFFFMFILNNLTEPGLIIIKKRELLFFLLLFCSFVFVVSQRIHYSSLEMWNSYVPYDDKENKSTSLIWGNPKPVRSDEWLATAPASLAGYKNIPKAKKDVSFVIRNFQNPWDLLFHFDLEIGYSYHWNFFRFGSFLGFFLLLMLLTRSDFYLSIAGSLFLFFSSFNRWWDISTLMTYFSFTLVASIYFIFSRSKWFVLLSYVMLLIFGKQFVMTFYPAYQVPLSWLMITIIAGFWLDRKHLQPHRHQLKLKSTLIVIAAIGLIALIINWYIHNSEYLSRILNTVYPGRRVSTGGTFPLERLFSGYYDMFYHAGQYLWHNICETSGFILLFPIGIFIYAVKLLRNRKEIPYLPLLMSGYLIILSIYCTVGFPKWLSYLSLFSFVPAFRSVIAIGFASVIFIAVLQKDYKYFKLPFLANILISGLSGWLIFQFGESLVKTFHIKWITNDQILYVSLLYGLLILFLLEFRLRWLYYALALTAVIVPSWEVNPIAKGLNPILDKNIVKFIIPLVEKDPGALWVAYGNHLIPSLLKATNANLFNGVRFPPDLDKLRVIDPKRKFNHVYNRFAHITMHPTDLGTFNFKLEQADSYTLFIHPCSPKFREIGVKYIVIPNHPVYYNTAQNDLCGIKILTPDPLNTYLVMKYSDEVTPSP